MNPYPEKTRTWNADYMWDCYRCEDEEIDRYYNNKHDPRPPAPEPGPSADEMKEASEDLQRLVRELEDA